MHACTRGKTSVCHQRVRRSTPTGRAGRPHIRAPRCPHLAYNYAGHGGCVVVVCLRRPPALVPRPPPHHGITRGGRGRGAAGVNARPRRRGRRWPRTDRRRVLVRSSAYNSCHPPDQGPPRRARAAAQVRLSPRARIERGARPRTVAWLLLCTACTGPPRSLLLLLRARCVAGPWWPVPCVGRACKRQSVAAR